MAKKPSKSATAKKVALKKSGAIPVEAQFAEVSALIRESRSKAVAVVNAVVIETYWQVGRYISAKINAAQWGQSVVQQLADYLQKTIADPRGFSARNLWRMKQFHDLYGSYEILSTVLTQLSWSAHLHIISKTKTSEERAFYLHQAIAEHYDVRSLAHAIDSDLFKRSADNPPKLSSVMRVFHPQAASLLRDSYSLAFLGLPDNHS